MPIRMTGLTSGLDTESIVNALMSAQRTKQTKVENKNRNLSGSRKSGRDSIQRFTDFIKIRFQR